MTSPRHHSANALPLAVLSHILQYVPLKQRLGHCALVSTAWAAAAAAATTTIQHRFPAKMRAGHGKAVLRWVGQHAQHVTSLQLFWQGKGTLLPFCKFLLPGLRHLHLDAVALPALYWWPSAPGPAAASATPAGAAGAVGAPAAAPDNKPVHILLACQHLTRLELVQCWMLPSLQVLMALTVLTDLRHLRLAVNSPQSQKEGKFMTDKQRALLPLPNQMWEGLTKLTHLDLAQQVEVTAPVVAHLTYLTRLQELLLNVAALDASSLEPLQQLQSLNSLQINSANSAHSARNITISNTDSAATDSTAVLTTLTQLSRLAVVDGGRALDGLAIHPGVLSAFTGLRVLQLQPNKFASWSEGGIAGGAPALQTALSQCTAITDLRLCHMLERHERPWVPTSVLAAVTASKGLQRLDLENSSFLEGAWQHIFADGQQLSALQQLMLADVRGALTASELEQLVSCCPALKSLGLKRSLQYDVTLDPLLRLSGLTSLALVHGPPDDSLGVLQQLTGLRSLEIGHLVLHGEASHPLSREGLLLLTVLTQLTRLTAEVRAPVTESRGGLRSQTVEITSQVPSCLLPDVWRQIQEACNP